MFSAEFFYMLIVIILLMFRHFVHAHCQYIVDVQGLTSRKHAYIILTPLNLTFI